VAGSSYSQIVDLENLNSSLSLAVLSVPPGSRVLNLGPADASISEALEKRGCTVRGIDVDVANLKANDAFDELGDETFDVVLAVDVLERLRDPAPVLKHATTHLTAKGIAIVSIPNVTHAALRLSLLQGRFSYTEQGLLDRTHLRFFDRPGAERLINEAGLTISQHLRVRRELDETEIAVNKDGIPTEVLERLANDPDATTYQFVFVAGRENGGSESRAGGMLSECLLAEKEVLLRRFRELEAFVKGLQIEQAQTQSSQARASAELLDVRRERDELREELIRRTKEVHETQQGLKHSRSDVAVKEAFITELRQRLLSMKRVAKEKDELSARHEQLLAKHKRLIARRDELTQDRQVLLARQRSLETTLNALRTYTNSAGFRLVEGIITRLRRFPVVFTPVRALTRKIAGRKNGIGSLL
jgi:2-polyprenyl-3-methyl-5-hydroxy-6-metoxy-1,4-benzoquinol methylase